MTDENKISDDNEDHNPVEKTLDIYFYGIPQEIISDYKFIDEVMDEAIKLSGATIYRKIVEPLPPGASGVNLLLESESAWHATPETVPNFMSFKISTCGYKTHPMSALRYPLEKLNPSSGKICYYKEGLDLDKRRSGVQKTIDGVINKYYNQFDISKYRFEPHILKDTHTDKIVPYYYDFYFYDPLRLTQRMASEERFKWPLTEETRRLGIWIYGEEFIHHKNGNGNGHKTENTENEKVGKQG
jgi:S-adenosylmethionine/arginine decarboxylase-like enzyme